MSQASGSERRATEVRVVGSHRPRVAVLDDDREFAEVIALVLEEEGMRAEMPQVAFGEHLADVLARGDFDLAILDAPGASGEDLRVVERLRADARLESLPILVCSTDIHLLRDHAALLASLPGVAALEKPFRLEMLTGVLRRLMSGSAAWRRGGEPDAEALVEVEAWLAELGERVRWPVLDVWTLDRRPGFLRCVAAWTATSAFDSFAAVSRRTHLPVGGGIPGRVWASGRSMWVPDLAADVNFPRLTAARRVGLVAAGAAPALDDGEPLGVVCAYTTLRRAHDEAIVDELAAAAEAALDRFRRLAGTPASG